MALELSAHKIKVNSIAPGIFKSEITESLMKKVWLKNVAMRTVPLRTYGTLDPALTSPVRYLIHDSSEYVSGNIFIADSGTSLPGGTSSSLDLSENKWDNVLRIIYVLSGAWLVSKHVCQHMRNARQKGSVINISSIAGLNRGQFHGGSAYAASKAGMDTLTKAIALELGVHKIRVNSIAPGIFKFEITEGLMMKEWLKNVVMRTVPLRTYGTSDPALTSLIRYLIHNSSEYVSGNIFIVDYGATLPGVPIFSSL